MDGVCRDTINTAKELYDKVDALEDGAEIVMQGWIRSVRDSSKLAFMEISDGSHFKPVQAVLEADMKGFDEAKKLPIATAVEVTGSLVLTPDSKQPFELKADQVKVLAGADLMYPLQKKRHSMEFLRDIAYLRPRANTFQAVFRLRSVIAHALHCFFQDRNFVYSHTPIITANDCEGAGELFRVTTLEPNEEDFSKDFFAEKTGLTVSGQLEAEAMALAFRNVYTFGPTFRAENSNTPRHASEFWMIEPEIAFADLSDDMDLAEDMIKHVINAAFEKAPFEMKFFDSFIEKGIIKRLEAVMNADFKRMTYTEAIDVLKKAKKPFEYPVEWGLDLQTEHERYLSEEVIRGPVFVTDYPSQIKAFYMRENDDGKTVAACDLLVPGVGEIIGGSQREERLDILDRRMQDAGINPEELSWYRELRKYGGVKHAGFGLGFDRIIMYLTGMKNIRDVIPFPRTPRSALF